MTEENKGPSPEQVYNINYAVTSNLPKFLADAQQAGCNIDFLAQLYPAASCQGVRDANADREKADAIRDYNINYAVTSNLPELIANAQQAVCESSLGGLYPAASCQGVKDAIADRQK